MAPKICNLCAWRNYE